MPLVIVPYVDSIGCKMQLDTVANCMVNFTRCNLQRP